MQQAICSLWFLKIAYQLVRNGYRLRVYVPYGRYWYPYFMRRLAERSGNVWFILRSMIRG